MPPFTSLQQFVVNIFSQSTQTSKLHILFRSDFNTEDRLRDEIKSKLRKSVKEQSIHTINSLGIVYFVNQNERANMTWPSNAWFDSSIRKPPREWGLELATDERLEEYFGKMQMVSRPVTFSEFIGRYDRLIAMGLASKLTNDDELLLYDHIRTICSRYYDMYMTVTKLPTLPTFDENFWKLFDTHPDLKSEFKETLTGLISESTHCAIPSSPSVIENKKELGYLIWKVFARIFVQTPVFEILVEMSKIIRHSMLSEHEVRKFVQDISVTIPENEDKMDQLHPLLYPLISRKRVKPVEERVAPAEERVKPVEEQVAPAEELVKPVEERVAPVEEIVVPVEASAMRPPPVPPRPSPGAIFGSDGLPFQGTDIYLEGPRVKQLVELNDVGAGKTKKEEAGQIPVPVPVQGSDGRIRPPPDVGSDAMQVLGTPSRVRSTPQSTSDAMELLSTPSVGTASRRGGGNTRGRSSSGARGRGSSKKE